MSSPELRIIRDADYGQDAGRDFDCAGQHPAPQPSQASAKIAIDSCLYPPGLPFLAEERADVTILFGELTWKHERLIEGLLASAGYRCQALPASSNHKLWAAKFVARHPNLISVELSNFKCGHDAFISRTIEEIIERSGKPHFSFRDLDENRPLASIRIRVETMHYFLRHYQNNLQRDWRIEAPSVLNTHPYSAGA